MDRYNEVKSLLKNWEQSFVQQRQRKPNKDDIDQAPEDTRKLYKEYRCLKQAKENCSSTNGHSRQNGSETSTTQEDSDCWGSHLSRSNLSAPSPTLTAEDRDSLQASAQYYGMKMKNNLAMLSKDRPASLKKSLTPGRTPLKSWKDDRPSEQTNPPAAAATPAKAHITMSSHNAAAFAQTSPFTPRNTKAFHGSQAVQTLCPIEPKEPFESYKPSPISFDESNDAAMNTNTGNTGVKSSTPGTNSIGTCGSHHASGLSLQAPSPRCKVGSSGELTAISEELNANVGVSGGLKLHVETSDSLPGGVGSEDGRGGLGGFRPSGGLRGGRGRSGAMPSLVSTLGSVDRGWLQRCQVFGEAEEGEKPGAGNLHVKPDNGGTGESGDGEVRVRAEAGGGIGNAKARGKGEKTELGDGGENESSGAAEAESLRTESHTETPKTATHRVRKSKGRGGGEKKEVREEDQIETGKTQSKDEEEETKRPDKKGRKRQREDGEDGGMRKRKRNAKKKEEDSDSCSKAIHKEGRKKRTKKADVEEGETLQTKAPEKVPQENLLGEVEVDVRARRMYSAQPARGTKNSEGNFVKINLKKKSHVKGYALRGAGLRKQMYMQKFQLKGERFGGPGGRFGRGRRGGFRGGFSRQGDTCYKCGGTGHWAIDCRGPAPPPPVSDDPPTVEEPFELPTLEEVARATGTLKSQTPENGENSTPGGEEEEKEQRSDSKQSDDVLLNVIRPDYERPAPPPPVEPLYRVGENGKVQVTPAEVYEALKELGYQSFRAGQEDAIMRILSGLSTLVVLSTGMGKSLCYQLPAYLYAQRSNCITLVISPLVSLMDDQLSGLPAKLKAACIHSNMTMKQREAAIEKVKSGQVCVLLLSPEALVGGGGSGSGCLPSAQQLPPVAFACIDEAHCVSEWSHNFRPCYLRLCKVLRERLGVRCLLGLTATATLSTALDIARHLNINDQDGIAVRSAAVPPNLQLSVSMDSNKDQALVSLLKGDRFGCLDSIIVYCTRREETVRVAALLRTCLQGVLVKENIHISSSQQSNPVGKKKKEMARKKIRKPLKWQAESYHAGLSASERRRVQNNFMCGELRVVVATVAFGMGLDKSDVRGIVHYNMPKSFESYVQEIGRAGRDGDPAHCHLFLDPEGGDLHELRRHIYADTVDYYTVKRLVQKVFPPCKCKQIHKKQQELAKRRDDIEDSELLEMMEVCERDNSLNPPAPPDILQPTEAGHQRDVPPHPSAEVIDTPPTTGEGREEEKEQLGDDGSMKSSELMVKGDGDWRTEQEVGSTESTDWPAKRVCHTHERAIPIQQTVEALDITEEGVETLLCYLELHPQRFVELLHSTLSLCKINCYDGPKQLQRISKICPPVAVVLARKRMAGERIEACDWLEFDVVELADTMGWQLPLVKRGLRQLQWSTGRAGGRSGILVEFSSPSFYFRSYGDLDHEEMDRVCHFLHKRVQDQEKTKLFQLSACFKAFQSVAFRTVSSCVEDLDKDRSLQLKSLLSEYFDKRRDRARSETPEDTELDKYKILDWENQIRVDIRSFLTNRSDEKFSGRAVARILHGIGSPCYPAQTYGRDRRYWRKYIQFDFNQLIRLATQEIIHFK